MKEKIKFLILGILIGAVITAGIFLLLKKDKPSFSPNGKPDGMPDMEQFENMDFEDFKGRPPRSRDEKSSESTPDSSEVPEVSTPDSTQAE